jgi:DNA-binding transcriptional LysR family regulator
MRVSDVDLRLLRVFKIVTDCGGFSAAEAVLNMNLSTISSHMSDLEGRLELRLCERGRRGFQLTEEGRAVYLLTEDLLGSLENFKTEISALRHQIGGELGIGIVDNTITDPHSPVVAALRDVKDAGMDLQIRWDIKSPNEIEESVISRKIHVGIAPFRERHPSLAYVKIYSERLQLYCAQGHPLFSRKAAEVTQDDLRQAQYVSRGYMRESKGFADSGLFKPAAYVFNMEALATLILSGRFIGYLPEHYAARWVEQKIMSAILPAEKFNEAEFFVVTLKGREQSMAVRLFLRSLLAHALH